MHSRRSSRSLALQRKLRRRPGLSAMTRAWERTIGASVSGPALATRPWAILRTSSPTLRPF
eukprot:5047920-Lingulodinium_polyedra.AAC.1